MFWLSNKKIHFNYALVIIIFSVDRQHVKQAAESLSNGNIIAVPTDTIYGVAGLAQNSEAIEKLYNIKQRDTAKPVAISVATVDDVYRYALMVILFPMKKSLQFPLS